MSDATNDTTRTAAQVAGQITTDILADLHGRVGLGQEWDTIEPDIQASIVQRWNCVVERWIKPLLDDLERLAGPVCDHPPCKGARAIEHHLRRRGGVALWAYADIPDHSCSRAGGDAPRVSAAGACWYCGEQVVNARVEAEHPPSPAIEAWLRARSTR